MTSKLQVTIPKAIAERHGIKPGDDLEWVSNGTSILVLPHVASGPHPDPEVRLRMFDEDTKRIDELQRGRNLPNREGQGRDWKREDLYDRGFPR